MRNAWTQIRTLVVSTWEKVSAMESRFHDRLFQRWPVPMRLAGALLRGVYALFVAPAFAVILALLLVGLVISDKIPFIVWFSVASAWIVATVSIAKVRWVNEQRIVRRILLVFCSAAIMALFAHWYITWCLTSYAESQKKKDIHPAETSSDQVAYEEMKKAVKDELAQLASANTPTVVHREELPNISLALVHPDDPALILNDTSSAIVRDFLYWYELWDLSVIQNGHAIVLPIPAAKGDWIRAKESAGPMEIFQNVKKGDHISGFIGASCPKCKRNEWIYVDIVFGTGGWYVKLTDQELKEMEKKTFTLPIDYPLSRRKQITQFQ